MGYMELLCDTVEFGSARILGREIAIMYMIKDGKVKEVNPVQVKLIEVYNGK